MCGTEKTEQKRKSDWTAARAAREAIRAEKVRWLVEHGFNEHTHPAHFFHRHKDSGCPYTKAGLYRIRDTMFRGKPVPGKHNAGSVSITPPVELLPRIREDIERDGTMAAEEPAPPMFSMLLNAGKWR